MNIKISQIKKLMITIRSFLSRSINLKGSNALWQHCSIVPLIKLVINLTSLSYMHCKHNFIDRIYGLIDNFIYKALIKKREEQIFSDFSENIGTKTSQTASPKKSKKKNK